jgi:hypothetical protein
MIHLENPNDSPHLLTGKWNSNNKQVEIEEISIQGDIVESGADILFIFFRST